MLQYSKDKVIDAETSLRNEASPTILTKETGWKYLLLSLCAFLGICLELVHAYGWEPFVFGSEHTTLQNILHWIITCITWLVVAYLLICIAKNKLGFDLFVKGNKMKFWQVLVAIFGIIISCASKYFAWNGFKVILEFKHNGLLLFIFQYICYLFETVLFLLIIVFGQKAIELWTKKRNVPWGGIICGLTWGIVHIISRGNFDVQVGLFATVSGFLFGAAYLLTNRDFILSWLILFLMFVL
jgi:hypothetical protein